MSTQPTDDSEPPLEVRRAILEAEQASLAANDRAARAFAAWFGFGSNEQKRLAVNPGHDR